MSSYLWYPGFRNAIALALQLTILRLFLRPTRLWLAKPQAAISRMCGRFALNLDASELEQRARQDYVADLQGWRETPAPDNHDENHAGPSTAQSSSSNVDKQTREHGFRPFNYNVAPQTNVPVIYRPQRSEGVLDRPALQSMKWGLQPHWLKEKPDYVSAMRTINSRDDTVKAGGMWQTMRNSKRCVVLVSGFYEWLKKSGDRIPHYTKRTDEKLMCFAGLWDSVLYEDASEALYTFSIITTDSNDQLKFLHDRMPVLLETPKDVEAWLDVSSGSFSPEVASLMKPFEGKLSCYAVPKEVGKVGNNSEDFIKPIAERKGNIASFFANAALKSPKKEPSPIKKENIAKRKLKDEEVDIIEVDKEQPAKKSKIVKNPD